MLETKMVSFMKHTKDRMNNPLPDSDIDKLILAAKQVGATHCELAQPLGLANTASDMLRWANKIHAAGMLVTFRSAHVDMEGLYGHVKAVGTARKPLQFYIDEAANFIIANPALFKDGDEWAVYPERTEAIWQDSTSWFWPNDPGTYANFFISLADTCKTSFTFIGKKVQVGLSSNNASEIMSGWMSKAMSDKYGYVCVDHYVDGDPAKLEADIRSMATRMGKPIYLQESAADRFTLITDPAKLKTYFDVLKRLVKDGVIVRFGYWGMWAGTPEGCIKDDFTLNEKGLGLKDFFAYTDQPGSVDLTPLVTAIDKLDTSVNTLTLYADTLKAARAIIYSSSTNTTKINKLKALIPW